ncbi:hypothetical protein TREMEDRAFT_41750 [Tremella mesenterica DSM 1558]|uniref:uncharacterized protein n=1 Tax=Tremella mesenterica (strain ATCC 24925 / CBS 8224 / DSM 1558 / NBRC 9311 / NRRL Y-6157 / RJB 2259-6 / UBC 559-6) TaxID=578456 RepID=UPI0003F49438|nr:uncharacterized protein TREMEDRAFT_41750 [Tremella mesenterica DSM 1558]EIW72434.1 hypothetical protein TREMEDRAFT_41750 [Tremella mesenterica DSM 1558]
MSTAVAGPSSSILWPNAKGTKLHIIRDPTIRVRQAVRDNNVTLLARLQRKCDLRNTDRNRLTSLSWAAIEGSLEAFEWLLLDYGHDDQELSRDADNNTILHLLASVPSPPTLSPHTHLLRSNPTLPPPPKQRTFPELQQISLRGKTALHVAAQAGNTPFINLLCDLGADVDLTDLQGNTPLHYASAWGHLESLRCLMMRGCQFASRNFEGFTASDFSYDQNIMINLQNKAKELFEERRFRRRDGFTEQNISDPNMFRSGSDSTGTNSFTSGSIISSNQSTPQYIIRQKTPSTSTSTSNSNPNTNTKFNFVSGTSPKPSPQLRSIPLSANPSQQSNQSIPSNISITSSNSTSSKRLPISLPVSRQISQNSTSTSLSKPPPRSESLTNINQSSKQLRSPPTPFLTRRMTNTEDAPPVPPLPGTFSGTTPAEPTAPGPPQLFPVTSTPMRRGGSSQSSMTNKEGARLQARVSEGNHAI